MKKKNNEVGKMNFEIRMACIDKEIIHARAEGMKQGIINRQVEPFGIRKKHFYPLIETKKVEFSFKNTVFIQQEFYSYINLCFTF